VKLKEGDMVLLFSADGTSFLTVYLEEKALNPPWRIKLRRCSRKKLMAIS